MTVRYHLTNVRMTIVKKTKANNTGKGVEKLVPLHTLGGSIKRCSYYAKRYGSPLKIKNRTIV
jgi:hypothetical protein